MKYGAHSFFCLALCCFLCTVTLYSCAPKTALLMSWSTPYTDLMHYKNILVVALMGDKDVPLRQDLELDMITTLSKYGVTASSAYEKFGATSFEATQNPDAELRKLNDHLYDAVICMVMLDREQEHYYVSPTYSKRYRPGYNAGYFNTYTGFPNYYDQSFRRVYRPGYYVNTLKYVVEVNVFDFKNDEAIYSAEKRITNPGLKEGVSSSVVQAVIQDMLQKKMITATPLH